MKGERGLVSLGRTDSRRNPGIRQFALSPALSKHSCEGSDNVDPRRKPLFPVSRKFARFVDHSLPRLFPEASSATQNKTPQIPPAT
jgi:hypothetical protein